MNPYSILTLPNLLFFTHLLYKTFNMQSVTMKPFCAQSVVRAILVTITFKNILKKSIVLPPLLNEAGDSSVPFMFLEMKKHCEEEHQNDLGMYVYRVIAHNISYFNCRYIIRYKGASL